MSSLVALNFTLFCFCYPCHYALCTVPCVLCVLLCCPVLCFRCRLCACLVSVPCCCACACCICCVFVVSCSVVRLLLIMDDSDAICTHPVLHYTPRHRSYAWQHVHCMMHVRMRFQLISSASSHPFFFVAEFVILCIACVYLFVWWLPLLFVCVLCGVVSVSYTHL